MASGTERIYGQPSYVVENSSVRAAVTARGGHLAPVEFRAGTPIVTPYAVAPWWNERQPRTLPTVIRVLRGDFFCLPFGGNETAYQGERHPLHGDTANATWRFTGVTEGDRGRVLTLTLRSRARRGRVTKRIALVDGEETVYCQHRIEGMQGSMCFGHHATLHFAASHPARIALAPIVYGQVYPGAFERPEARGYSALKPGAEFESLRQVPLLAGGTADLTQYPARRGYEDLVMVAADPSLSVAWTTAVVPGEGYLWFALKDPRVLRHTVLWFSNGGRHYPPWNGRHVDVVGLEEVTAYFHLGVSESVAPNPWQARGLPTSVALDPRRPLHVNYIMGIARVPGSFRQVTGVEIRGDQVEFTDEAGQTVRVRTRADFVQRGDIGDLINTPASPAGGTTG
jgi:hypothetical protein